MDGSSWMKRGVVEVKNMWILLQTQRKYTKLDLKPAGDVTRVQSSKHVPVVVAAVFVWCVEGLLAFPTGPRGCTSCHSCGPLPLTSVLRRGGQAATAQEEMAAPSIATDLWDLPADSWWGDGCRCSRSPLNSNHTRSPPTQQSSMETLVTSSNPYK